MKIAGTTSTPFVSPQAEPASRPFAASAPSKPLAPSAAAAPQFVSTRPADAPATYSVSTQPAKPIPTARDFQVSLPPYAAEHEARMASGTAAHFKLPA